MDEAHRSGSRYAHSVLNADESGGTQLRLPPERRPDVPQRARDVPRRHRLPRRSTPPSRSVRPSTWADGFERSLLAALLQWLRDDWSFERPVILTNEHLDHQIATIERSVSSAASTTTAYKDMYTSHVCVSRSVS
ncbi:MAG: hypothetical protein R2697_03655 [Ilumatobacteraceae bacterium]